MLFLDQNVFPMLQKILTDPLMSHGLLWWCFSYLSGHEQYTIHTASMEGLRALGLNLKYLKLCSEDERGLTALEQHEGELLMTQFGKLGKITL